MTLLIDDHRNLEELVAEAKQVASDFNLPEPLFSLQFGWADNYVGVFRQIYSGTGGMESVLERAETTGRVLISGPGGSGKTVALRRVYRLALERDILPILVELKNWRAEDYGFWQDIESHQTGRIDFLLRRFGQPEISTLELDKLAPAKARLVIVDGLNEVLSREAEPILRALDEFAATAASTSVVVADRLVRRRFPGISVWQLGATLPLSAEAIEEAGVDDAGDREVALLSIPFFLDEYIGDGERDLSSQRSRSLENWYTSHTDLQEAELLEAGRAAFRVYDTEGTRNFALTKFAQLAGERIKQSLLEAGALVQLGEGLSRFKHHLLHDYLASHYLAEAGDAQWNRDAFNVVSFYASHFDTLGLVLEQLSPDEADRFVERLYDWNLYASAYATAQSHRPGSPTISEGMETVLLAMLADRLWDIHEQTVERARDALMLFTSMLADTLLTLESRASLIRFVSGLDSIEPRFETWRDLFCQPDGWVANDEVVVRLKAGEPIVGWTLSNVLKRARLEPNAERLLRTLADDSANETVRWRAVHVLGAFPSPENATILFRRLVEDADRWVRFGAVRSIVEIAARGNEALRRDVFESLQSHVDTLMTPQNTHVIAELQSAVFVKPDRAPSDWMRSVIEFLGLLIDKAIDDERREELQRTGLEVRRMYDDVNL